MVHTFPRKIKKKSRKENEPSFSFFFFLPKLKDVIFSWVFGGFFSTDICCFPVFDNILNNFTIFLYICDVPILMWVIPTSKTGTELSVRNYSFFLLSFRSFARKTLALCYVVPFTCLFCHLSLFFLLYPGEKPAHLAQEVCYVCGKGLQYVADVCPCTCWGTRTLLPRV